MQFARRWEMAEMRVVNLFGWRAIDPTELQQVADPIGPENDAVIMEELLRTEMVVAAWGNKGVINGRSAQVLMRIWHSGVSAHHFGLNVSGEPVHPLYVPGDAPLLGLSLQ